MTPPLRPRRPSSIPAATAAPPSPSPKNKSRKGANCGECEACKRDDCRQCAYCIDMRKYGGPNKLRKRCQMRRCTGRADAVGVPSQQEDKEEDEEEEQKEEDSPTQTTKSKRIIKKPKQLTPNHTAAHSYDDTAKNEGEKRKAPPQSKPEPPAKRQKLEAPSKKASKAPEPAPKSYGSGKRLAPAPTQSRIPPPPELPPPPSPIITRIKKKRFTRSSASKQTPKIAVQKFVPKSLPFLVKTQIAGVIVRDEIRARNIAIRDATGEKEGGEKNTHDWKLEEVINFYRGVYMFGWGNWTKVRLMIKTRDMHEIETYAYTRLKRSPELQRFFGRNNLRKLHVTYANEKVKRLASSVPVPSTAIEVDLVAAGLKQFKDDRGLSNLSLAVQEMLGDEKDAREEEEEQEDQVMEEKEEDGPPKKPDWLNDSAPPFLIRPLDPTRGTFSNGKVAICLGGRVIETENKGHTQEEYAKIAESHSPSKAEIFNPHYRPSAPTSNAQQIYIPGNRVYARWMNTDDPGSYGSWYPGFVQSSMVSPDQRDYDEGLSKFPSLIYQVRFDDGILSGAIKADDIMMSLQYEQWLKELEEYYWLPITEESTKLLLVKGQCVHAKWIDPTDPDMHARWIRGEIVSRHRDRSVGMTYLVKFDNGDEDELRSEYVLGDSVYEHLLQQKIEQGRNANVSGIDLLNAASKIASPIKNPSPSLANESSERAVVHCPNDSLTENIPDEKSCATIIESDLLCREALDPPIITSTHNGSSAPKVHFGLYMKIKIAPSVELPKKSVSPKSIPPAHTIMTEVEQETTGEHPKKINATKELSITPESSIESKRFDIFQEQETESQPEEEGICNPTSNAVIALTAPPSKPESSTFQLHESSANELAIKKRETTQPTEEILHNSTSTKSKSLTVQLHENSANKLAITPKAVTNALSDDTASTNLPPEVKRYCLEWVIDVFQESCDKSDSEVRATLESRNHSKENFGRTIIALQLTQMRIMKDYIKDKESNNGVALSEEEQSDLSYICTEAFVQLVSEVAFQLKGKVADTELTKSKLFERYQRICLEVTRETLKNVKNA